MKKIVKVLESDMKKFNSYVGNFNRILRKNGMPDLSVVKDSTEFKVHFANAYYDNFHRAYRIDPNTSHDIWMSGFNIEIDIPEEILKVGDYQFIGSMVNVDGIWQKHFVSTDCEYNDFICEENFRCDHCHTKINSRTGYLFFADNDGNRIVVGRKCARSYFGFNVEEIVNAISNFDVVNYIDDRSYEMDEDCDWCGRYEVSFDLEWFIPIVAYYTQDFTKWRKKEEDFDMNAGIPEMAGTSESVKKFFDIITIPGKKELPDVSIYAKKYFSNDDAINAIKKYWENNSGNSDFSYNCKQIVEKGHVSRRWIGYAAWAIFQAMKNEASKKDTMEMGEFVGAINERSIFNLTVSSIHESYSEGYYGAGDQMFLKVRFDDENGNHFQTNCHSGKMMSFFRENEGKQVKIKATIVSQFERKNGQKVNFITRTAVA